MVVEGEVVAAVAVVVAGVSAWEELVLDSNLCRHPSTALGGMMEVELLEQVAVA